MKDDIFEVIVPTEEYIETKSGKKKVKVFVSMFGRETLVELDFEQIEKL